MAEAVAVAEIQRTDQSLESIKRFMGALFVPSDVVLVRPIETWIEGTKKRSRVIYRKTKHVAPDAIARPKWWANAQAFAVEEKANLFFGVCPRFGNQHDLAWQIRTVRVLWADIDHCTVEQAIERCERAELPRPSIVVSSGNGVHLYWLLTEPYLVDDVGEPLPVFTEFKDQGEGKKKKPLKFITDPATNKQTYEFLNDDKSPNPLWPTLSPKGLHAQKVVAGIGVALGGDHTHDLARLLRLPATMNRKNERNGATPVPCELIDCEPGRRYQFSDFEKFAEKTPAGDVLATPAAKIKLPSGRKLTPGRKNTLTDKLNICAVADDRSVADFAMCCWSIERGIDKEAVWSEAQGVGKFAQRGRNYFDLTWGKAEETARQKIYDRVCRRAGVPSQTTVRYPQNGGAAHESNGIATVPPPAPLTSGVRLRVRPTIVITTEEAEVNFQALQAIAQDRTVFHRAGQLTHVIRDDDAKIFRGILRPATAPRIATLPAALLREKLSAAASWVQLVRREGGISEEPGRPPDWTVQALNCRGEYPGIRALDAVIESPVLLPDGLILDKPGYHRESRLLYEPSGKFPEIPEQPLADDISIALDLLLDVVVDFPFFKNEHKAAWLAFLLTPLARHAFSGPVPLFLVDSNIRGSGKGLLCDITAMIGTGRNMPVMSNPRDDDEARKRITALAICGDPLINIDNIVNGLGSAALDAALTSTTWKDRILGKSEMVELPLWAVWSATGNNVILLADTARRVCHIRLNSKEENPEERQGFRYPNIRQHVHEHRHKLLAAALTILRGYCAAGRPDMKLKPWGSFEGWSDLVRAAVVWCGMPDPGLTRQELREQADEEASALRAILAGIQAMDPLKEGLTVSQMIEKAHKMSHKDSAAVIAWLEAITTICDCRGREFPSVKSIGMKLKHLVGRVVDGRFLTKSERDHTSVWKVVSASGGDDSGNYGN